MRSAWLIAVAFLLTPLQVSAQDDPAPLQVQLGLDQGQVTVSFDATSAFTESFRRKLSGGLTSRVLIEVELVDSGGASVLTTVRACQLRLDIWEDVLFTGVTDETRTRRKIYLLTDDALRACGVVDALPLADRSVLRNPEGYRVLVRVALNPVSPEVLDKTREFMANPRGTVGGRPRAFFGAVAKLFRTDSASSGERFFFQSSRMVRPAVQETIR